MHEVDIFMQEVCVLRVFVFDEHFSISKANILVSASVGGLTGVLIYSASVFAYFIWRIQENIVTLQPESEQSGA